jgi:tetratricopeptide (TPR) repeat protein
VELAVARTYEREQNWRAAITNYANWLENFPANDLRPQSVYSLAWANYQAGNETNAFVQFTNFVAQFPTNTTLAPLAQWWVADHFFRAGDFVNAERNYKYIFQNADWQGTLPANRTNLFYPAQMMAGRAALARGGYPDAIGYFTGLTDDTNCPAALALSASFAYSSTLMLMPPTGTNSPLANFQKAANVFGQIALANPTNESGALAWFYLGDCYLQLTNYDAATNAYAQVINSPSAGISARSRAQIALGGALEKMAALAAGEAQTVLRQLARDSYLDVFDTSNLQDGEVADDFWVKKAGLQALSLVEQLGTSGPDGINGLIDHLERLFPQAKESLEKKRAALLAEKK